jgi:lipopolysaccharide export system permease protein
MKKLLFQKFLNDNFRIFSFIILSFGSIVWILQSVNYLDFVTEDGHGFKVYFYYTILNFPKIIHRILPFAFFISLFYLIVRYEENNQLLIYWIHGVKKTQLVNSIIIYSILLAFFQIILGAFISPKTQDMGRSFIRSSNIDFFPSIVRPGKFVDAIEGLTIFVEKENKKGIYENIYLKDDLTKELNDFKSQIIFAKKAELFNTSDKRYFKLVDGRLIKINDKKINIFEFKTINFDLSKFVTKTTTYPKIQEVSTKILIRCIIYEYKDELKKFKDTNYLSCNKDRVNKIIEEIFKRFFLPVYIPLISLFSCFLFLSSKENKEYKFLKNTLFLIIFFIIVISEVSLRFSTTNYTNLIFFASLPIVCFILVYLILIKKLNYKI